MNQYPRSDHSDGNGFENLNNREQEPASHGVITESAPDNLNASEQEPASNGVITESQPDNLNASEQEPASHGVITESASDNLNASEQEPASHGVITESAPDNLNASEQEPASNSVTTESQPDNLNASEQEPASNGVTTESQPDNLNASEQEPASNGVTTESQPDNLNASEQEPASNGVTTESAPDNLNASEQEPASNGVTTESAPDNLNASEQEPASNFIQKSVRNNLPDHGVTFQHSPKLSIFTDVPTKSCDVLPPSIKDERTEKSLDISDSIFEQSHIQSTNATEKSNNLQRAFPKLTQMLMSNQLEPRMHQLVQEYINTEWDTDWLSADLSFFNTYTVVLVDSGETRQVCPQLLSLHSTYFKAAFQHSQSTTLNVCLGSMAHLEPHVRAIIDSINSPDDQLDITVENYLEIFLASDFLGCNQLQDRCVQLMKCVFAHNAVESLRAFHSLFKYFSYESFKVCLKPILRNINKLNHDGYLQRLEVDELEYLLKHDMLNCKIELDVLRIIDRWMHYRRKVPDAEISPQLDRLMCCVRSKKLTGCEKIYCRKKLPLTTKSIYKGLITKNADSFSDFFQRYNRKVHKESEERQPHQVVLLLICCSINESVISQGIPRSQPLAHCMYVNPYNGKLLDGPPDGRKVSHVVDPEFVLVPYHLREKGSRAKIFCVAAGNNIYVVGGIWALNIQRKVLRFDRQEPQLGWRVCSQLNEARIGHCCAVVQGYLYAIGGCSSNQTELASVERFPIDKNSNRWSLVEQMLYMRKDAAAVEHRGRVFVVGGIAGLEKHDTAEIYCPMSNAWTLVPSRMSKPRCLLGAVVIGQSVYVVGGKYHSECLRSVERWQEGSGWHRLSQKMNRDICSLGCVAVDERILMFGGLDSFNTKIDRINFLDIEDAAAGSGKLLDARRKALKQRFSDQLIPGDVQGLSACVLDFDF
ncbi:hypothetical protein BOX15_Mlig000497g2 [Macrostomum lignano]|uniref:BACK domain-containing protein n=2 Tax=Macrostomum lignano TaxID=282301 RepID=A0A267EF86_9PLAT|nr:hypothetical protein BOX15_Mlig000497g2 [Macrostomum lignano]